MVAMATMEQCLTEEKLTPVAVGSDVAVVHNAVEIHEEKVFVQLEKLEVSCNTKVWILDTTAMNHMNGSCVMFVNLDNHVRRTVRFRDDSAVRIEGLGCQIPLQEQRAVNTVRCVFYSPTHGQYIVCGSLG
jgi:hypothetical protein